MQCHHNARHCWVHSTGCVTLTLLRAEDTTERGGLGPESPAKIGLGTFPARTRVTVPLTHPVPLSREPLIPQDPQMDTPTRLPQGPK